MPTSMELLLLATGFTGALTLRWLLGLFRPGSGPRLTPHFIDGIACADVVVKEIAAARREVILMASVFACRSVAQALVDAPLRGVKVEVLLDVGNETDPNSDLHFLVQQGLPPLLDDQHPVAHGFVILDGTTVLTGNFTLAPQAESPFRENLLVVRGDEALASAFRQEFATHKAHARAVPAKTVSASPATIPVEHKVVASLAQSLVESSDPTPEPPAEPAEAVVTPASAELFARLRKELAAAAEPDRAGKNKKAG